METTKLSSKGQIIIPKTLRAAHHWDTGLEFIIIEMGDGILLKPKTPFQETTLEEVAGCLKFDGGTKTDDDIESAMKKAARSIWRDND